MMDEVALIIKFPTERDRNIFLGWLSNGGGEYEFMEYTETAITRFDYSKAFPGLGYRPEIDGSPVVSTFAE